MRIAYVCADAGVPVFGHKGCSIHVQEVVRAMTRLGIRVDLFAARGTRESRPAGLEDVAVHSVPHPCATHAADREREAWNMNGVIARMLERAGPFDAVYERHSLWSVAAMQFARDQHVPGMLEVNAPLVEEQAEHRILCNRGAAERAAAEVFGAAHTVVAVSDAVATYVKRFAEPARLHVVPNGVDPARFPMRSAKVRRAGRETFTVGFVGSLKRWHGLPVLVEAFAELHRDNPRSRLLIVGDGPERDALEAHVNEWGIRRATVLTGAVTPAAIPPLIASMDAAVAPYSSRPEFYFSPLKVLEYMAAAVPVIGSRLGQVEQLIGHERTGLLCAPDDPDGLARCLRRLYDDPRFAFALGAAARAHVSRQHTWQAVVRRIFGLAGLES